MMNKTPDRYIREAALSQAPLMLGECGCGSELERKMKSNIR
ncbi:hypothetical protein Pla52n_38930 [Stieleria varia]|uniref:Uncharacterized protein n=1 Tax=Stieleria varia TaxID=2528005 RepID=A0A5C6AS25_9BACT|nr:hypothetical protein Pla52n_38930 [Stieleria varia]